MEDGADKRERGEERGEKRGGEKGGQANEYL
jgi:hypothetical protein